MVAEADSDPNNDPAIEPSGDNPNDEPLSNDNSDVNQTADSNKESEGFISPVRNIGFSTIPVSEASATNTGINQNPTQSSRPRRQNILDSDLVSTSTSNSNHSISDIFQAEKVMNYNARLAENSYAKMKWPKQSTDTLQYKYIEKKNYTHTPETTSKLIESLAVNQYTKTKTRNMREIHNALASTGLLTMLLEQRK